MGNPLGTSNKILTLEHDVQLIEGFIALDGSSNVIGVAPTAAPVGAGPYTLCKGLTKNIGVAGAVVLQPHTGVGQYFFTLDEPWQALLSAQVTLYDQGAVQQIVPSVRANVRSNITGPRAGVDPGTETALPNGPPTVQTIQVRWRTTIAGGALQDPAINTGFWVRFMLKRTAIY